MTTVTNAAPSSSDTPALQPSWLERLATLVVRMRSTAGESLEVTIARSVDEAFASIAREFRR